MNLLPRSVDFGEIWSGLKGTVEDLLLGNRVDNDTWNENFLVIYHLCVSTQDQLGTALHQEVKHCLENCVSKVKQEISCAESEDVLLHQYFHNWECFSRAVEQLNFLFRYLNSHVMKKHKYSRVNINYTHYGIKYEDNLLEIGEMAFDIWERNILSHSDELIRAVLGAVQRDRMGVKVDRSVLKAIISSFIVLRRFKAHNRLQLYEELFEIPFFRASSQFFMDESRRLLEMCDCSEFMRSIQARIRSENGLCSRYLHLSSHSRLRLECTNSLLSDNVDYINQHCAEMLLLNKRTDLGIMYDLLSSLDNGLEFMVGKFEHHLHETGLTIVRSLTNDGNLSTQFVESMLTFHRDYHETVKNVFRSNPRFFSALDKACAMAINYKSSPKAVCRSPELLAKYCDLLLRKGSRTSSEVELEENFSNIIVLFSYIDDKDIFHKFYARLMARRLIFHLSTSLDAEEMMVNKFRQSCGYEYTKNLLRMFTDMAISLDLNAQFKKYLEADWRNRRLSHGYSVQILQADTWPIAHSNLPEFIFPPELEKFILEFEIFYKSQFGGRKLIWMYGLSLVELKFCHLSRSYLVTMEMFLASVLLQFNQSDVLSYKELLDLSRLQGQELTKQLQLLVDSKILSMQGSIIEKSVFQLNSGFTSKRTKFKLLHVNSSEVAYEEKQMINNVEQNRRFFLQASIVRIMKARRELKHSDLIEEVLNQTKLRFVPRISTIKKCIEILLEKQYIGRAATGDNVYVYIA